MKVQENIFPIEDLLVLKKEREENNGHRAHVYWMTGLSGSGKSTLARYAERRLFLEGVQVIVLDGDNLRNGLNKNLNFSEEDRAENIRRVAELSKLFLNAGFVVIASFISPTNEIRKNAESIIGETDFSEVYVNASFETCDRRDVKGLYAKARSGEIKNFTGLDAPFEIPEDPAVILNSEESPLIECGDYFVEKIKKKIQL